MPTQRIAITTGEPAGIGPDLALMLRAQDFPAELVLIADPGLLEQRARELGLQVALPPYRRDRSPRPGTLSVLAMEMPAPCRPGELDGRNAGYVLSTLHRACQGCLDDEFQAMVTAPVQKSIIAEAGHPFSGHTEFLAEQTGASRVVMLLVCDRMRVALATTHLPLAEVPGAITPAALTATLSTLHDGLRDRFGIEMPRIAVLGLNPHAGEAGHLGREELDVIAPTVERLRRAGMILQGPLPADTAFTPRVLDNCDAVLAMYHDQGLPVLKYAGFGEAVNVTLGLPIIRTSVDHGTALDLAGRGGADPGSLRSALRLAMELAGRKPATAGAGA
jgi:4-hydroxythreonine-4-phosphate dehydrogenase